MLLGFAGLIVGVVLGLMVSTAIRPAAMPVSPSATGWTLWRQTLINRQLGHVKVRDFSTQPACLADLKGKIAEGQSAWPMIYLSIDGQNPGWLACFPTVGYDPDSYK